MAYRRKKAKKTHPNNKPKAQIVYPKPGKKGCGFTKKMVLRENVEEEIEKIKKEIYG